MDHVFSTSIYGSSAKHEDNELKCKREGTTAYSTDRENEVRKRLLQLLEIESS